MRMNRVAAAAVGLALASGGISAAAVAAPPSAAPQRAAGNGSARIDRALGSGLGRMLAQRSTAGAATNRAGTARWSDTSKLAITDAKGRVLVQLTPQAGQDRAAYRAAAERAGLQVTSTERSLGTLEGFVALGSVRALAALPGTGTLAQAVRPRPSVGSVTSQGVRFQRADKVQAAGVDGTGITVGALSDSFDGADTTIGGDPLTIHAAQDVASRDLPGVGNPRNSTPVVNLEDIPAAQGATDEGRAMLQLVHDMAPGAKLCFATAFNGTVGFADNIRRLADPASGCGADVIVDDVNYFDEPFFSEGMVGDAVDDVTAQGVSYFSSVGNDGDKGAWRAALNLVTGPTALAGTNIDLTGVDPALYDGGFQDFKPGTGVDVAQTLTLDTGGGLFDLQWNDPFDLNGATFGTPYLTQTGEVTTAVPAPTISFTTPADAVGQLAEFRVDGIPSGTTDLILTVKTPSGTTLGPIDTGGSPETTAAKLEAGTYTITVEGFDGAVGDFTATVRPILSPSKVSTDLNALFFLPSGEFLFSLNDANTLTGRPLELGGTPGPADIGGISKLQLVIARSGTGPTPVTQVGYINSGGLYTSEYFNNLAPATFGHATADGATAVGAYDPFRPFLPEFFTSPGGRLPIFFDSQGNRFATPKVRQVPQISATDGGNTTFFATDSRLDTDTTPNFFGTSASAPHAAAIAALMLDKAGGPRTLTPAQVRTKLQASTFAHDLDPNVSKGAAGGITITAKGQQGSENDRDPGAMKNSRFFDLTYTGSRAIRKITFYGGTASPTARTKGGVGGIVFDTRPLGAAPYRDNGFPFTVGAVSGGLTKGAVKATFSAQVATKRFRRMTLTFTGNGLNRGERLQFGVDRDLYEPAPGFLPDEGNGADELGGAVEIPTGRVITNGMRFTVTRVDGTTFNGYFRNSLGKGWTALDGFGVVNAEAALAP